MGDLENKDIIDEVEIPDATDGPDEEINLSSLDSTNSDAETLSTPSWKRQKREKIYLDNQTLADGESFDFSIYRPLTMSNWFTTFMFMNVPIFGLLYLLFIAIFSHQPLKKDFARAYLVYQLIFTGIAIIAVLIMCYFGVEMLDNALKLMQEL